MECSAGSSTKTREENREEMMTAQFKAMTAGLNPEQSAAVSHGRGPALILAGAGSGKTRVLIHRIASLLANGVRPQEILALTFTNKAAQEMRSRVREMCEQASIDREVTEAVTLSTFHSFGAIYLRQHGTLLGRTEQFVIYDKDDQLKLLRDMTARLKIDLDHHGLLDVYEEIQRAKHRGLEGSQAQSQRLAAQRSIDLPAVGAAYDDALRRANAFDFGDLIVRPLQLLTDSNRQARGRRRWSWILVDEFQDTNRAQLLLLQTLCPPHGDLFVVGDDDQSIYGWRGAEVDNILHFNRYFPSAQVYKLQQNYRSKGNILTAANKVIQCNASRMGKVLWTAQDEGARLTLYHASSDLDEASYVASKIGVLISSGEAKPSDFAILYRANHLTLHLESALRQGASVIPYVIVRGQSFFERAEVKDAVAYLRLLVNPWDVVAFQRASMSPSRGVGKGSLAKVLRCSEERSVHLFVAAQTLINTRDIKGRPASGFKALYLMYTQGEYLQKGSMADQAEALLRESGLYEPHRLQDLEDEGRRGKMENILQLIETVKTYEEGASSPQWAEYLEQIRLVNEGSAQTDGSEGAVSLMTIHAAKGLEFPYVFVIGLEEDLFPNASRQGVSDLEEERRLFYVALTRAEQRLWLTYATRRALFGAPPQGRLPSRFLEEVDDSVIHNVFPSGIKTWRDRNKIQASRSTSPLENRASSSNAPPQGRPSSTSSEKYETSSAGGGIEEITHRGLSYRQGQQVHHRKFGAGRVLSIRRQGVRLNAKVRFSDRERTILLEFLIPK
jgi:DNA helicase II / ATP-dependent DNA helicase PcrA